VQQLQCVKNTGQITLKHWTIQLTVSYDLTAIQ